jgi:hypothetical protein
VEEVPKLDVSPYYTGGLIAVFIYSNKSKVAKPAAEPGDTRIDQ